MEQEEKLEEKKTLKQWVYETISGGLKGTPAARAFSLTIIILIVLSVASLIMDLAEAVPDAFVTPLFWLEAITVAIFTLEYLAGLWTADLAYPKEKHPRLKYILSPMAIITVLAVAPFYAALALRDTELLEVAEMFGFLRLLHILKIGEYCLHAKHHNNKKS